MASDAHSAALLAVGSTALYTTIQNCLTHSQMNNGKSVLYSEARTRQSCSCASHEGEWRYSSIPQIPNLKPGGEWSALRPVHFTCVESAASNQQNKG